MRLQGSAVIVTGLLLLGTFPVHAQDEELTHVKSRQLVSYAAIRKMPGLVGLTFIDVERRFVVVARRTVALTASRSRGVEPPWEDVRESEGPLSYALEFYQRKGALFLKIAMSDPGYIFVGMHTEIGDEVDRLFTYWQTGSAEHLIIFARHGERISKAFSSGHKLSPEFVRLGNDGEFYMVVAEGRLFTRGGKTTYPKTARIYAWEGNRYVLKKEVPWEHRLEALKDQWPREYPKE